MRQLGLLIRRLVDEALAAPATLLAGLSLALGFVLVNNGLLGGSPSIAKEAGGDYLAFVLPAGVLVATLTSGAAGYLLAQDREDHYLERLLAMPIPRPTIVLAPMLLSAGYAALQATIVISVGALLGAPPATGFLGALAIVGISCTWGMGISGFMTAVALTSGRIETIRIADLVAFPLLFLSPLLLPQSALQGWLQSIASLNPTTYVIEGLRSLMIKGWDPSALWPAVVAGTGFALSLLALASFAAYRATARR